MAASPFKVASITNCGVVVVGGSVFLGECELASVGTSELLELGTTLEQMVAMVLGFFEFLEPSAIFEDIRL